MTHETRLQKLESQAVQQVPAVRRPEGPGLHSEARLQRVLDAIAKHEAEHGPLPPVDWNEPCDHPVLERIRLRVLSERNAKSA